MPINKDAVAAAIREAFALAPYPGDPFLVGCFSFVHDWVERKVRR
jgi:hypothetical protein